MIGRMVAVVWVVAAGCVGGVREPGEVGAGGAQTTVTVSRECVAEESCADRALQCASDRTDRCASCSCDGVHPNFILSCLDACSRVCNSPCPSPASCGDDEAYCTEHAFVARLPEARDERVYEACRAAWDQSIGSCGRTDPGRDVCDTFARVERAEVTEWYECWRSAGCGDSSHCFPASDYSIVSFLCDGRDEIDCPAEFRDAVAHNTPWLRDDAKEAVMICDGYSGTPSLYTECVNAWAYTVFAWE